MSSSFELEKRLREVKPMIEERYKVRRIGYFGSFARGEQTDDSDVDLLVEFSETPGWEFFDLQEFLEQQLHRKVDLVTRAALRPQMRDSILNQVRFV